MGENPALNRSLGNYRILEFLSEGGMARVYRAEHQSIGKEVAIKVLKAEYSRRKETIARFFHEAKAVNKVRHENLVDILDFGQTPSGEHFIVMEMLRGEVLSETIRASAPFPIARIGHLGLQICAAL